MSPYYQQLTVSQLTGFYCSVSRAEDSKSDYSLRRLSLFTADPPQFSHVNVTLRPTPNISFLWWNASWKCFREADRLRPVGQVSDAQQALSPSPVTAVFPSTLIRAQVSSPLTNLRHWKTTDWGSSGFPWRYVWLTFPLSYETLLYIKCFILGSVNVKGTSRNTTMYCKIMFFWEHY